MLTEHGNMLQVAQDKIDALEKMVADRLHNCSTRALPSRPWPENLGIKAKRAEADREYS